MRILELCLLLWFSVLTPTTTKPQGCTLWTFTPNTAAYNGQFYGWPTVSNCKAACLKSSTCVAVDAGPRGCVLHHDVSDLTATYTLPDVTHFVLNRSCQRTTSLSTSTDNNDFITKNNWFVTKNLVHSKISTAYAYEQSDVTQSDYKPEILISQPWVDASRRNLVCEEHLAFWRHQIR